MLFVDNQNVTDPRLNLAIEEHLLRSQPVEDDLLLLYINEPSVILGRNQVTIEEINREFVEDNGIHVVRRLSGGGAVYHDLGNLNFSFITQNLKENVNNFRKFTGPVIRILQTLCVEAGMGGRNDILVDGLKVSGNAQYVAARRMVSHGTLLFNSDLSRVAEALKVKPEKIISKGIKSVRSRVANISEFLPEPMAIETFRARLLEGLFEGRELVPTYKLTSQDWEAVEKLADERYRNWDWNYGRSPAFNIQKTHRFIGGEVSARIDVKNGVIETILFSGDFFGQGEISELESLLTGVRYSPESLAAALDGVDPTFYFSGVPLEELLALLY